MTRFKHHLFLLLLLLVVFSKKLQAEILPIGEDACCVDSLRESNDSISTSKDSVSENYLGAAVVSRERGWVENDKIVFLPSRKEKNLSNSPATLLKAMHLPFLREEDGVITSASGQEVTYFINGVKAEKTDISTFWPSQVRRVEYLENPTDPNFAGAKIAVNFIMSEYSVGGVTRLDAFERIPNYTNPEVASKLVYKKHTFGLSVSPRFDRTHGNAVNGEETYKNLYYNSTFYPEITRSYTENSYERENSLYLVFNARYRSKKFRATHGVTYYWVKDLGSGGNSTDIWSDNLFNSTASAHFSEGKKATPQLNGDYLFKFSDKWYLTAQWGYAYAHSNNTSWNSFRQDEKIYNATKEDVHSANILIMPNFLLSEKVSFQWRTTGSFDWFASNYKGTANEKQRQKRQNFASSLKMKWEPVSALSISPEVGVYASLWEIETEKFHSVKPTAGIHLNATLSPKIFLSGNASFYTAAPSASASSTVMIKSTDLLWIRGNTTLKDVVSWSGFLSATYLTCKWLSLSANTSYVRTNNHFVSSYITASQAQGGLIKSSINAAPDDYVSTNLDFYFRFLNGDLTLRLDPSWRYYCARGIYSKRYNHFTFDGSIDYTLGDCSFAITYKGPYKDLNDAGMQKNWRHDKWNASFTYGNGNWYFSVEVEDIFNKKAHTRSIYDATNYISTIDKRTWGRSLVLNLTYTFGYGKKVDRNISLQGSSQIKTSIVGAGE